MIVTGGWDKAVKVWSSALELIAEEADAHGVCALQWSVSQICTEKTTRCGTAYATQYRDAAPPKPDARTHSYYLVLTGGPVLSAAFSPDGATIASAGAGCDKLWGSAYIKVWDAGTHLHGVH
jgi:WD40 repeat protein